MIKFLKSFNHAKDGILFTLRTERNFIIELIVGCVVLILAIIVKVSLVELMFILSAIFSVLTTEVLNTSIEHLSNAVSMKRYSRIIKVTKDLAAAGVLLSVYYSIAIGTIIFGSKILKLIAG